MLGFAIGFTGALLLVWLFRSSERTQKVRVISARWPELPRESRVEILEAFDRIADSGPGEMDYTNKTDEELRARVVEIVEYARHGGGDIGIDLLEYQVIEHAVLTNAGGRNVIGGWSP